MDDALRAGDILHTAQRGFPIEPDEEIAGEQRFRHPGRPLPGAALEAHTRQENIDLAHLPEMGRRNVLMLRLGTKAKPGRVFCLPLPGL